MNATRVTLWAVFCVLIAGMAGAQIDWVEYESNPVIDEWSPGEWDDGEKWLYDIIEVDGTYHLFYGGRPVGGDYWTLVQIGHATSTDGVEWVMDPANPVLTFGDDGAWDDTTVAGVAVIHDGSEFRMWYGGHDGEVVRAGYATSPDGSVWTGYEGNPIIDVGPEGSFDDLWVLPQEVVIRDGVYQMWYLATRDAGPDDHFARTIGYAESGDGLAWTKHAVPVLEPGVGFDNWLVWGPMVVFDGVTYHMWYTGADTSRTINIGYAASHDGIEWTKYLDNPVLSAGLYEYPAVLWDSDEGDYRMWFTNASDFTVRLASSDCCNTPFASLVPAAGYGAGAEGSFYVTDLDLSNAGAVQAEYRFSWLPRGEQNVNWISSETFTLGAGQSVRYENVLSEVFGLEPDAYGAIVVEASIDVLVMARVYNRPRDGSSGTFGQAMPVIPSDEFIAAGERRRILFGTENGEMRTNIGCQNMRSSSGLVNLELLAADGTPLETKSMLLRGWSNDQLNRVFHDYMPMTGAVDVWTNVPSGLFYCYGSVLDNVTNDPTTVRPQ